MTSVVEVPTVRRSASAARRRAFHEARVRAARGSRLERLHVVDWLKAELANGGDLDRVVELARSMNGTSR